MEAAHEDANKSVLWIATVCNEAVWHQRIGRLGDILKPYVKPFLIVFGIYIFGMLPLIIADVSYMDDIRRVATGGSGWGSGSSRYLSDFLSHVFHASSYLSDISPLTQILACAFMAIAGVATLYIVTGKNKYSVWEYLAVIPLALSPFFLQCMSFKYDAPYMAISVLACIVPFLFINKKPVIYCSVVFWGSLCMCLTYQASSGIVPLYAIYISFVTYCNHKSDGSRDGLRWVVCFLLKTLVPFCLALGIYRLFIMADIPSYVSLDTSTNQTIVELAISNYKEYFKMLFSRISLWKLALVGVMCVGFIVVSMRKARNIKSAIGVGAFACVVIFVMLFASLGVYPFMQGPTFSSRGMYGFGIFFTLVAVYVVFSWPSLLFKLITVIISWLLIVFVFQYGNALSVQNEWTNYVTDDIALAIADLPETPDDEYRILRIENQLPYAPALRNEMQQTPILYDLLRLHLAEGWLGWQHLILYYGLPMWPDADTDEEWPSMPLVKKSVYYELYADDERVLVVLNQ